MVNRVILVGNLTRDAESIAARSPMTRMRLATNAVWRDAEGNRQESAEFHTVISFGRLAEVCGAYCVKGRRVYVEGKLRTREYEGSDGVRKLTTEVIADTMRLLDRRDGAEERALDGDTDDDAATAPVLATAG
jgi:single-strand DNA-binding protein